MIWKMILILVLGGMAFLGIGLVYKYILPNLGNYYNKLHKWFWGYLKQKKTTNRQGQEILVTDHLGQPVLERVPGRWDEIKKNIGSKILKLLILIIAPLLVLYLIKILNIIGVSIIFGITTAMLVAIGPEKFFGRGMLTGLVVTGLGIVFPSLFYGTIATTALMFLYLGVVSYAAEQIIGKNYFPWLMVSLCSLLFYLNLVQAALAVVLGHQAYLIDISYWLQDLKASAESNFLWKNTTDLIFGMNDVYPKIQHLYAESSRIMVVSRQLLEAFQYVVIGLLIILITTPGEIRQWWQRRKGKKGEEGFTGGKFIALDLAIELILEILSRIYRWLRRA